LISEMTETIDKIRQNRETNSGAVREHKIIVENEIQQLRDESQPCKFHNTDIHAPCSIN
jgi:hypothetical protein